MPRVSLKIAKDTIKVYINDILHISLPLLDYIGVHSYINRDLSYKIEFLTKDRVIEAEYLDRDLWEEILNLIDIELWNVKI